MDHQTPALIAGALTLVRVAVALRLTPFLGGRALPWLAWAGLSVAVTLALWPFAGQEPAAGVVGLPSLLVAGLREALVGAAFGLAARLAYGVLESAGALLAAAVLTRPDPGAEELAPGSSLTGLFVLFGTAAFLLVDGHHALLAALVGSLRCVPVGGSIVLDHGVAPLLEAALGLFSGAFAWAVMIAAPVYVAGLIADALVALVSRGIPVASLPGATGGLRALLVQLALIAVLAGAVTAAVGFLERGLAGLPACGG
jgi:flagellar biosynthetic protein FliR